MMRRLFVVALVSSFAATALAQAGEPRTLPLDRFRPTIDASGFSTTEGGEIPGHLELQTGVVFDYALNPLVVRDGQKRVIDALVQNRVAANVLFTIGLFEYVSLGVDLPLVLFQNEGPLDDVDTTELVASGLSSVGIGDFKLAPKIRILREDRHYVGLSLITAVTVPTALGLDFSNNRFALDYGTSYLGEGPAAFTIVPEVAVSANPFGARLAANLAYRMRPIIRYSTPAGTVMITPELNYRLGAGYDIGKLPALVARLGKTELPKLPSVLVYVELFGATADNNPFGLFKQGDAVVAQEVALANSLEWALGTRWAMPWLDLHLEGGLGTGLVGGFGTPDVRLFGGLRWAPTKKDEDGDGVLDESDACPSEPEDKDQHEDSDGCPDPDNDADGLPDAVDQCPSEPEDVDGFEDTDGCPDDDNDGDGISDRDDKCTDEAGPVETQGCPVTDRDGDGVSDGLDRCPDDAGSPAREGCPVPDTDLDGLDDDNDDCPSEPGPAERNGCPVKDKDGDGIEDKDDKCPDVVGSVEMQGCPLGDRDLDGVLDQDDQCPDEKGPLDRKGCPIPDKDGDGIEDKVDTCPEAAGPPVLGGCPDGDGDGLADKDDRCPDVAGLGMFKGCPDTDRDSVPDPDDKCPSEPETINGVDDEDGCPDAGKSLVVVTKEKIEISETVYFKTGSARLDPRSFNLLNQVAAVLKANPQIRRVRVEGHTDGQGNDANNKRLSQQRADSVLKYLVDHGVEADRLEAMGYGEEQPIAPNDTEEGRARNRRVELVILEQ